MNERMNESLSALVDGEADELEIRRLLNQAENDADLRETWRRYQMIGALMRGEAVSFVDLSKGINQAIDGEPMDEVAQIQAAKVQAAPIIRTLMASAAVAASVTFAVIVGVQWQSNGDTGVMTASSGPTQATFTQTASVSVEQQAQLEQAQRKLQEYVLQHSEQASESPARSMLPFARTVNFQQESTQP